MRSFASLALLTLLLVACGPAAVQKPDVTPDEATMSASLLTLDDLEGDWRDVGLGSFSTRIPGEEPSPIFCGEVPQRAVAVANVMLQQPDGKVGVIHTVSVYPDRASAETAFDDIVAASADCRPLIEMSFSSLDLPNFGDETFATLGSTGDRATALVYVREGNAIIDILHAGPTIDPADTEAIVRRAVERLGQ